MRTDWSIRAIKHPGDNRDGVLEGIVKICKDNGWPVPDGLEELLSLDRTFELDPSCYEVKRDQKYLTEIIIDVDKIPDDVKSVKFSVGSY
jgi:hypothetical protein